MGFAAIGTGWRLALHVYSLWPVHVDTPTAANVTTPNKTQSSNHIHDPATFAPETEGIEENFRYDFSLLSEDGQALQPVFGPSLTGLANLGNSCYMASVLQTLVSLPSFRRRSYEAYHIPLAAEHPKEHAHEEECDFALPAECVECQVVKTLMGWTAWSSSPQTFSSSPKCTSEPGLKDGEQQLPEGRPAIEQLQMMGFTLTRYQQAFRDELVVQHMEDASRHRRTYCGEGRGGAEPSAEMVGMLADMGFTSAQPRKALKETLGDAERAVEWLFSHRDDIGEDTSAFAKRGDEGAPAKLPGSTEMPVKYRLKALISHKGPSVHSGHSHIRVEATGDCDEG
ncbi:hypothetical protein DFP72DRAFT_1070801 [Ephemerocybe angulata]|uniref:UBA domain-containing protein n=1 Tax=Ephemerocybe angulata TaxID=980116 RepID=A0A8H6HSS0_9AGAR|nr:hypothetical protein DFP72DRAFT_1070801 [Tulosesus angulatus]